MITDKSKLRAIRLLVFSDKTKKEIAQELDITEQTLYNWLKDREFNNLLHSESKVYYSYIRKETFKKLNSLLIRAFEVIGNSLNSPSEKVRVKSAFDILEVYSHFEELKLLDVVSLNELSEFVENANITNYDLEKLNKIESYKSEKIRRAIDKREEAQKFLNRKDLTELLGLEDETKTEKTEEKKP